MNGRYLCTKCPKDRVLVLLAPIRYQRQHAVDYVPSNPLSQFTSSSDMDGVGLRWQIEKGYILTYPGSILAALQKLTRITYHLNMTLQRPSELS